MNGSFPSLPDVRQGETTPPVAKAFTMPVVTVDARCYAVHVGTFLGFHHRAPETVAPAVRTPLADTPDLFGERSQLKLP